MCQNKLLGVVGGVLGRNASLIFQNLFTGKSVFLINQFTFWNFSNVNTIKCIFADRDIYIVGCRDVYCIVWIAGYRDGLMAWMVVWGPPLGVRKEVTCPLCCSSTGIKLGYRMVLVVWIADKWCVKWWGVARIRKWLSLSTAAADWR